MSEMKKQVIQALLKQMRGLMKEGHAEAPMSKGGVSEALEEAKEEAMEGKEEEGCDVSPAEAEEVKVKKKPSATISVMAIKKGSFKPPVAQAKAPVPPQFKKK